MDRESFFLKLKLQKLKVLLPNHHLVAFLRPQKLQINLLFVSLIFYFLLFNTPATQSKPSSKPSPDIEEFNVNVNVKRVVENKINRDLL